MQLFNNNLIQHTYQPINCLGAIDAAAAQLKISDITTLNEAQGRLLSFTHVFSTYTSTELTNTSL